ncbi:hypothetical protein RchiOBHm_Chr7g0201361 [Rosa chinensis]|uniref:Nucleocapsid protein n=1 Tax=Rosa chinensis TaxID=74649 RepID=A0A2P6P7X0_ROSCH|nr:uncharacterized protein LOC112176178 [Rosa chinensis]PRQ18024.1 hypothetical protein RchiOBHm_Chr7g0201361 [Rosa chinensis]
MADIRPEDYVKVFAASGQCTHVDYDYKTVFATPIYKVGNMDAVAINNAFNTIMGKDKITEVEFFNFICAGLNIRSVVDPNKPLLVFAKTDGMCSDYDTAVPSSAISVNMDQSIAAGTKRVPVSVPNPASSGQSSATESATDQALAHAFICAWLTRFCIKEAGDQLKNQLASLQKTYLMFYKRSSTVFDTFRPTKEWVNSLRLAFSSFTRCRHTLALHMGVGETYHKVNMSRNYNLLRFCYFQNLEFMGMHSYALLVEIMNKLSLAPALVLTWLRMDGVTAAIDEIAHILQHYDNGMIPDGLSKERVWKYARLINERYFNRMQTSYNPELVAMLSYIKIFLGLADEIGYRSPLNIAAIKGNNLLKASAKRKATIFIECKEQLHSVAADASIIEKIYAKRKTADLPNFTTIQTMEGGPSETFTGGGQNKRGNSDVDQASKKSR